MKKVLAKDLKVGDVVCDTKLMIRKYIVKKIDDETIYLLGFSNDMYFKDENGFATFPINDNIHWYMEE